MDAMGLKKVCRICLCDDRALLSLSESIAPKFDSPPSSVVDLWKIFTKILTVHDGRCPDKICTECFNEIQRMYSFILKCERSGDTLKKMEDDKICLKKPEVISALCKQSSSENNKSENDMYPNILQIKNESIGWNDRENEDHFEDTDWGHFQINRTQVEDVNLGSELLDHVEREKKIRKDKLPAIQDIKQELELDINMDSDEFAEFESEDKSGAEIVKCPACHYECRTRESLEEHILRKHMEDQICKLCNKEFECSPIEHYSKHLHVKSAENIFISTNREGYKCEVCSKSFGWKSSLNRHLRQHTGETFKCEICPKIYRRKDHLTDHLKCHTGERSFKCDICPKAFVQKCDLQVHLKRHTGERSFECEVCPKKFILKSNLTQHLKSHTDERPFKCEICPKTFALKCELQLHSKYHTGERPFKCDVCPKKFANKSNLTQHLRYHTGERLFKCEICPKAFHEKATLKYHLMIHTGERPFKCDICLQTFRQKNNLKYHSRLHKAI